MAKWITTFQYEYIIMIYLIALLEISFVKIFPDHVNVFSLSKLTNLHKLFTNIKLRTKECLEIFPSSGCFSMPQT